jgi:hypothetical protein
MTTLVAATPSDLIQQSQLSTDTWGGLTIATGTALKLEKCFAYFLLYKLFVSEHASMGNIGTLSPPLNYIPHITGPPIQSHLTVPLPDGSTAPTPTIPTVEASLMLSIWFGPSSRGTTHMKEKCRKGFIWADILHSCPLPPSEAWVSFTLQLCLGMLWGIVMVILSQHELYKTTQPVFF